MMRSCKPTLTRAMSCPTASPIMASTGAIIYRGPSIITAEPILGVVTFQSANAKTGNMAQLWILAASAHPLEARQSGHDAAVCGACPLRDGRCYVVLAHGPGSVWRAAQNGRYPEWAPAVASRYLGPDRPLRLGAYGDPAALPHAVIADLIEGRHRWTGYTHDWRRRPDLAPYVMASADTADEAAEAHALGFRTFRARAAGMPELPGEITCPAAKEAGQRTTCAKCGLCDGSRGTSDRRKSITILYH